MTGSQDVHRNHYKYLDALRGVAAISVVLFHIGTRFGGVTIAANGYLAVDFFFVLSGVVLASSYEKKLGSAKLLFSLFAGKRIVRLFPMSAFGIALGTAYLLVRLKIDPAVSDPSSLIIFAFLVNLIMLPKLWYGPASRGETFPANGALWSLFFEMSVNLLWAALLPNARLRTLFLVASIGGVVFLLSALQVGSADIGWNIATFVGGAGRTVFGFVTGIIMYRLRERLPATHAVAPWLALVLLIAFIFMPVSNLAWTLTGALVAMPFAVMLGLTAGQRRILPMESLLGEVSYPLYAVHLPLLMIASGIQKKLQHSAPVGAWAPLLIFPMLGAAYLVLKLYDEPVRAKLRRRNMTSSGSNPIGLS